MVKLNSLKQIEHLYAFENAVVKVDTYNGAFGDVVDGEFVVGEGTKAIMNVEVGDEAGFDTYPIKANTQVRVVDLEKLNGELIEVYGDQVPTGAKVGNALTVDTNGNLVVGTATAPYLKVEKVFGNVKGVEVKVVTA